MSSDTAFLPALVYQRRQTKKVALVSFYPEHHRKTNKLLKQATEAFIDFTPQDVRDAYEQYQSDKLRENHRSASATSSI